MRIILRFFILLLILLNSFCSRLMAQGEIMFRAGADLSSSLINHVFQDNSGMVWISTEDGLNVYNGVSFFCLRHSDSDTTTLLNNYVRFVFQSRDSEIFVGTNNGLQYFDRSTQKFSIVRAYMSSGKYLSDVSVSSMCQVNDTLFLIGSSGYGLFTLKKIGYGKYEMHRTSLVNKPFVEKIAASPDGYVFISYLNGSVVKVDQNLNLLDVVEVGVSETVFSIGADSSGHVFFGTSLGRVLLYDNTADSKYVEVVGTDENFHAVRDFYVDERDYVCFATDGEGVKYLRPDSGDTWELRNLEFVSVNGSKLKVHSIMRDNSGNFWFGCFQRGILLRPTDNKVFDYIGSASHGKNVIGECSVLSVLIDSKNNLYVGTDNDGIYVLDKQCRLLEHYQRESLSSLVPNASLCVFEDSRRRIWVGGYLSGLVYIEPGSREFRRMPLMTQSSGDQLPSVYDVVEDKEGGFIYASASGVGVYKINVNTLDFTLFDVKDPALLHDFSQNQINNTWINCLMVSRDRKLYIGTYSGFTCMNIPTESFVDTYGRNCFLEGVIVNSIYEGPDNHIWLGTNSGLYDFCPQDLSFTHFDVADGLPSEFVSAITGDNDGNLWISTKGGISCFDKRSRNFVNYYESDGLYSLEFSQGAVAVARDGRIFFGSQNGVVDFKPFKGRPKKSALNIMLTNFIVNSQRVYKGLMSGRHQIIDTALYYSRVFCLDHRDNTFDVEFAAMQFGNPESLKFTYRLDGGPWTAINGHRVSFANLDYGTHQIEAYVSDNVHKSETLSLEVRIDYPWYRTSWFYTAVVLLILAAILAIAMVAYRRYLLNQKLKQISHVKEINDGRLEYFTNISHEIRTPMSLIVSPLTKLMASDPDPDRQRSYKIININAQRVLNLINQLMDLRKIDNSQLALKFQKVDFVAYLRAIYESFEIHASQLGVDFGFDCAIPSLDVYIDPQNFDKVIVNILSNAFKFTPRGRSVIITLSKLDTQVELVIKDNGTGMSDNDLSHIFDLFYQGDNSHRITMVGTGVGMYITKQLVALHHGTITPFNNSDGTSGCSFRILLPLGRQHIADSEIISPDSAPVIDTAASVQASMAPLPASDEFLKQYAKTKFRIMVVDNDEHMRKYIVSELAEFFHVMEFSNAEDAWSSVVKMKPDLIISDIMMGPMNGIMFCKKIKQNLEVNHIPVVLLTAMAQDDSHIKSLDVGADAFIAKPFNISVLIHTITNLLKKNISLRNRYQGRQEQNKSSENAGVDMKSPDERLLQRVMKVISDNISNPGLTVETIASQVGISRVHLHRKLKELTNQSTLDFLRNVRLNLAVKLLEKQKHSILEVAQQVGFVSTAYFSTVFKDRFGMTPTAYMNEHSQAQAAAEETDSDLI